MRQHQQDIAALEQWTPLIAKLSYKAAQRAVKIGSHLRQDDFKQELSITLLRAIEAYDPNNESGAKLITFLYRSFYNEINKLLNRDDRNAHVAYTMSGDSCFSEDDDEFSIWGQVESDCERSAENLVMDEELETFVRNNVSPEARAVLDILTSNAPFVVQQLESYNIGVDQEFEEGGIRRFTLDMNFQFVCKLLGFGNLKTNKLAKQVESAVASYGVA